MALVSLKDVRLAFGGPELIEGVSVQLERRERACLVGRNGTGKSTLMKIISGRITPDAGEDIRELGLRIAELDQEIPQDLSGTVFEIVAAGLGGMVDLLQEYHLVSLRLSHGEDGTILEQSA